MNAEVLEMKKAASETASKKRDDRWIFWMEFCGKYARCHQMPERSFFLGSYQFPLCARCTGIQIGRVLAVLLFPFVLIPMKIALTVLPLLLLPLAIDGLVQKYTKYESNNCKRVITGILWGFASISLILRGIVFLAVRFL
jgi:uncharacterized membrane protein